MESNEAIKLFFPTPVYVCENLLSSEENEKLKDKALELYEKLPSGGENWFCNTINSLGTFDLRDDPIFENLNSLVSEKVQNFANFLGSDYEYKLNESWYNVSLEGNFQEGHVHGGQVFSCVYYASVPPGSGQFVMYSPDNEMGELHNSTVNDYNAMRQRFVLPERSLIVFRSFVRHMVTVGSNKEPRVSFAYNFN